MTQTADEPGADPTWGRSAHGVSSGGLYVLSETARTKQIHTNRATIQAGSQPLTLSSLLTEWVRDWKTSPYADGFIR